MTPMITEEKCSEVAKHAEELSANETSTDGRTVSFVGTLWNPVLNCRTQKPQHVTLAFLPGEGLSMVPRSLRVLCKVTWIRTMPPSTILNNMEGEA